MLLGGWSATSLAKDEFLPPEQAYKYSTRVDGDQLIVTWRIDTGLLPLQAEDGRGLAAGAGSSVRLGEPAWPKGESHTDEYFGTQEIYRGAIDVPVALSIQGATAQRRCPRAEAAGLCGRGAVLSAAEMEDRRCIGAARVHSEIAGVVLQVIALHRTTNSCRRIRRFGSGVSVLDAGSVGADLDHRGRLLPL